MKQLTPFFPVFLVAGAAWLAPARFPATTSLLSLAGRTSVAMEAKTAPPVRHGENGAAVGLELRPQMLCGCRIGGVLYSRWEEHFSDFQSLIQTDRRGIER